MVKKSKALVGIAGVHFVAAALSQRGYIVALTSRNTEGIDILASSPDGSNTISIQVKTSDDSNRKSFSRSWWMNKKSEGVFSDSLFYVFVDLKPEQIPDFYVVPSKVVAEYIKQDYETYMKKPIRKGKRKDEPHKKTDMRTFEIKDEKDIPKYFNKWDLLGL